MTGLPPLRLAALNVLAAACYLLLAQVCLALAAQGPFMLPLWLPAGFGLSVLVLAGPRLLPGLCLGQAATSFFLAGASWYVAGMLGVGGAASAWLGAVLFRHLLPEGLTRGTWAPARFLAIAYGCAALTGLFGPMVLWLSGVTLPGGIDATIIAWWLADALGIVVLAPPLLAWREALCSRLRPAECGAGMAAVAAATVAFGLVTFVADRVFLPSAHLQAALLLPAMMLLTMRCHPAVPFSVNLVVVAALVYGAAGSLGPLLGTTPIDRAYALHGFVLISSVTLLFLAAHIHGVREMAAAAQAGEERFRRLTALTSDWYWEQDADFRFSLFDGPVLGYPEGPPSQLLGKQRGDLPGFEPYNMSWEAHRADLAAHRTFHGLVLRHHRSDGRLSYYSISGEPKYDAGGAFAGYRGVGRDVTPEIESREALLASERQFHEVADATFEGLFIHDYGRIVFANRACAEMVGCSIEDAVGRSMLDFVAPEEHEHVTRQLARSQDVKHYETVCRRSDGWRFPVEVFGRPFVFQGKPMRIIALRDVGDRRDTEAALLAQIEFQRTLLDTIPNPVFYKDGQGRYLGYNQAFARAFGIGPQDYIGKTVFEVAPPALAARYKAADDELFAAGGVQAYEAQIQTPAGPREVVFHKALFADARGATGGLIGVIVYITERKKIEERLRRFHELSPAAIGIVSTAGQVLYMNPAAFELFGYRVADVPTLEIWWQVAYPDPAYRADRYAAWLAAVEQTLRDGRHMFRFDGRVRCGDGRDRWIETMASLGEDEIFMIFTDVTEYVGQLGADV